MVSAPLIADESVDVIISNCVLNLVLDKAGAFAEIYRVLRRDSHFYLFCDQETMFVAKPIAEAAGFKFWKPLVWDKCSLGMGYHYRARYEFVLFFEKGKRKLRNLGIPDC